MSNQLQKGFLMAGFVLAYNLAFGQEFKYLKGKVEAKGKDVVGVVVNNSNRHDAVITDIEGKFSIRVQHNDTLIFSAIQFKTKVLPIDKRVFDAEFLIVTLEEFVNQLDEVVVKPYNLSGDLKKDLGDLQLEKDVSAEALGLPNAAVEVISQSENKLHDADHGKFVYFYGVGFAININKVLNRLSGRTKMLRNRVQLDKAYEDIQTIEEEHRDSLLISYLKIPKNRYYDFIYYCQMDADFKNVTASANELLLWEFMIEKSLTYRKENDLD